MSDRFLIVGDPHIVVDEMADCEQLAKLILIAMEESAELGREDPTLLLMGDLYNNHAVIRVEVVSFWNRFFDRIDGRRYRSISLVGNHDRPQSGVQGDVHSLMANAGREDQQVVSVPWRPTAGVFKAPYAFIPYMPTPEAWVEAFVDLGRPPLVFCHQTFAGSRYENGFYAPDGVSTEVLGDSRVISGHIHTPQIVGNVWYPGAPRWRSISDANVDRFIYLIEVDADGGYRTLKTWATDAYCTPIRLVTVTTPDEVKGLRRTPGLRVTIQGDESFVKETEAEVRKMGIKFRSQVVADRESTGQVRESDGISVAFRKHLETFDPPGHTPKVLLEEMVAQRLRW